MAAPSRTRTVKRGLHMGRQHHGPRGSGRVLLGLYSKTTITQLRAGSRVFTVCRGNGNRPL